MLRSSPGGKEGCPREFVASGTVENEVDGANGVAGRVGERGLESESRLIDC
jgi:hypothetical protein